MVDLKNLNTWELIYYGYIHQMYDESFIFAYCDYILEHRPFSNIIAAQIAGLCEYEKKQFKSIFPDLLKIDSETFNQKNHLHNKVWFYLNSAVEIMQDDIID